MLTRFDYAAPTTVADAVTVLSASNGSRPLAGGHGVLNAMKLRHEGPKLLVDLRRIRELRGISESGGRLRIGALTTLAELLDSPTARDRHPVLVEAAGAAGDPQLRNRATVGGTLATRLAASDLAAALLLADAAVTVAGPSGERVVALDQFYAADGPRLDPGEIITSVSLPTTGPCANTAYVKVSDRATLQPVCGVAAGITLGADATLRAVRLAVTGATRWPTRLGAAEQALAGTRVPVDTAALPVGPDDGFVDDVTGSAAYRAHLTRVLAGRAITRAIG